MSNELRVTSCLSVTNVRAAGAAIDKSSMAYVEIKPEAQTPKSLGDGQNSDAEEIIISRYKITG